jgi:hypothetical protein
VPDTALVSSPVTDERRGWWRRALPALPPLDRRARAALAAILVVGALLRVGWAAQAESPRELRDPVLYMILADHVANGDGYTYGDEPDQGTTAYYPPGYPLALAGTVWLVDAVSVDASTFTVAVWLNVLLSVASIGLMFVLARRLAGTRVGLVAAAVWALWPNLVFHSGIALTETLFLFLLLVALILLLGDPDAAARPGVARLVAAGVVFGLGVLVRPVSLVALPLVLVLWWGAGVRAALWRLALFGVATVAVLVPWAVRSTIVMEAPVALSLNLGDNLCLGHNPGATGGFVAIESHCYTGAGSGLVRPEIETRRQSENIDRALRYIRDEPRTTLRRTVTKLRITLQNDADGLEVAEDFGARPIVSDGTRDLLRTAANAFYLVVAVAGVVGAVILARRPDRAPRGLFLALVGLVQLVPPLATFGDARFKMPLYPTLAVGAAVALVALRDLLARRPAPAGEPAGAPAPPAAARAPQSSPA